MPLDRRRLILGGSATLGWHGGAHALTLPERSPMICAHRGWQTPSLAENALSQITATTQAGAFMVEVDLARSADGTIFLMHDATVTHTTTGRGSLADLHDAEIQHLHLRDARGITDEAVPRYQDLVDWAAATPSAHLMLDMKQTPPAQAIAPVVKAGIADRVIALTFNDAQAEETFATAPDNLLISCLTPDLSSLRFYEKCARGRRFAAYVPQMAPGTLFRRAHQTGAIVISDLLGPGAVRDRMTATQAAHWLADHPVDVIVTNEPLRLRQALGRGR